MRECITHRVPMRDPGDVSVLAALCESGQLVPSEVVAIFGKTEGNGCVNDFTRPYSVDALTSLFSDQLGCPRTEVPRRIAMVISGGTEGAISPHYLIFSIRKNTTNKPAVHSSSRLAIGTNRTRDFLPEEIGRITQVEITSKAISEAMKAANLDKPSDVHFVQIKCPLLTTEKIQHAKERGAEVVTRDTYASMGYSRGAAALAAGVALGSLDIANITDGIICTDRSLWCDRASASAGVEIENCEVIVIGNSAEWTGDKIISHDVMSDAIDVNAIWRALSGSGLTGAPQLHALDAEKINAVFVKAEPSSDGFIRGKRHIMTDDSDINATRHARSVVGGVVAGATGFTDIFVSGGAEHQGPDGGGPIALISQI